MACNESSGNLSFFKSTLYQSFMHPTITMAYFIRSLIYLFKCLLLQLLSKCKQIIKNGFSHCKNSLYVKPQKWEATIWKKLRRPEDSPTRSMTITNILPYVIWMEMKTDYITLWCCNQQCSVGQVHRISPRQTLTWVHHALGCSLLHAHYVRNFQTLPKKVSLFFRND